MVIVCGVLCLVGCGVGERFEDIGAPFSYDNRPLSERMADRQAELAGAATTADPAPAAFAFADDIEVDDEATDSPDEVDVALLTPTSPLGVVLRGGPGREHREVLRIPADAVVATTGSEIGEWTHVDYGDHSGWVSLTLMAHAPDGAEVTLGSEPAMPSPSRTMLRVVGKVEGAGLNLRVTPDLESNIVALIPSGAEVEQLSEPDGRWVQVDHDGYSGWIWAAYTEPIG